MAKSRLKEILEREGIRQCELAANCRISIGTVNRACNGTKSPSRTYCFRILKALNLMTGKDLQPEYVFPGIDNGPREGDQV